MFSVIQPMSIATGWRPCSIALALLATLCLGVPENSRAQLPADKPLTEANAGQGQQRPLKQPLPKDLEERLEEVVVVAQRVEGAGGRRRNAAGRDELDGTDQISMDGFFDDIDGLSTLGGDDQGNAFSIDGLSADLSNVTLNGQGLGEGRGNGGFNAGDLPPEMIRRVELYKIPSASLEEGGAGGSVNLELRNPMEITRTSSNIKGRLGYVPDKNNFDPSGSFFLGQPSESRNFGYMLSVALSDRTRDQGSQDVANWIPYDVDGDSAFIPGQVRNSAVTDNQRNAFAGLSVGFRPHASLDISTSLFLSQKQRDIESHDLQHRLEKQRNISALAYDGRIVSELESSDASRKNLRIVGGTREEQVDSLIMGMSFNWRRSKWRIDGGLGYTADSSEYDSPSQSAVFEANSAFGYNAANDGSLVMSYAQGFPSIETFSISRINLSDRKIEDTSSFAALDLQRTLGKSFIRRVRFGGKIRESDRSRRDSTGRVTPGEDLSLLDFFRGGYQQTPWDTGEWPGSDMRAVNSLVQGSQIVWAENLFNEYDIEQQTNAGYLQADFRSSEEKRRFLVGNAGVRVVDTNTWIAGYQQNEEGFEPVAIKTHYSDVLPSIIFRIRVAERAALTLAAARVMTHPSFNDLAPGIRFNYSDKTAKAGNPGLSPFRANQFLAEITWAPERGRRLTGNLTYRDVETYFASGEESLEFDGDTYRVTRPVNGEDGYILTAGMRLEQNLRRVTRHLQNFTLSLSYLRNESSTAMRDPFSGEKLPLPNTAAQVAGLQLNYSKNNFAGKLSYEWRGKSLRAAVSESGLSVWNQPVGNLNLNLGWRLNEVLQLAFDARNLLEEEQLRTTDRTTQLWRISERDRTIAVTLRARW